MFNVLLKICVKVTYLLFILIYEVAREAPRDAMRSAQVNDLLISWGFPPPLCSSKPREKYQSRKHNTGITDSNRQAVEVPE